VARQIPKVASIDHGVNIGIYPACTMSPERLKGDHPYFLAMGIEEVSYTYSTPFSGP